MLSLRELQHQFAAAIYDGESQAIGDSVVDAGIDPARRLRIYRNNVVTTLTDALAAVFPVIQRLLGAECFATCAQHYLRAFPSLSGYVKEFGAEFASFLGGFGATRELAYLPDVARLEWLSHESAHSASAPAFRFERLAVIPPERQTDLRFTLHPTLRLLSSPFPVLKIWSANQPDSADEHVDLGTGAEQVLVLRGEGGLEYRNLEAGAYAWLQALAGGSTFEVACMNGMAANERLDIATLLHACIRDQIIVDCYLPEEDSP